MARIKGIGSRIVYVGIPPGSNRSDRSKSIKVRASRFSSTRRSRLLTKSRLIRVAEINTISNAQALYIFSRGSALTGQPPRPVLEPAILAPGNKEKIANLVALASKAYMNKQIYSSKQFLRRAGVAAKSAAYNWFTDSRNGWAPNSYSTARKKNSDLPGIDTHAMRNAITYFEKDVE